MFGLPEAFAAPSIAAFGAVLGAWIKARYDGRSKKSDEEARFRDELRSQLNTITRRADKLAAEVDTLRDEIARLQTQAIEREATTAQLKLENERLREEIEKLQTRLSELGQPRYGRRRSVGEVQAEATA